MSDDNWDESGTSSVVNSGSFGGGFGGSSKGDGGSRGGFGGGFGGPSKDDAGSKNFGGGFGGPSKDDAGSKGGGFGGGFNDAGGGGGFAASGSGGNDGCRACGEDGHFARDCPNKPPRDDSCRTCGESGHFSRDCPSKPPRDDNCRRCGEAGHFARDCTQEAVIDPDRPPPVTYIPPEPSEEDEAKFRTIAQGINFDKYDNIPVEVTGHGEIPKAIRSFEEANLQTQVLVNVQKANYSKPTPVQKYALPIISAGRDLMSCAQTGSGKTAAFLLPVLTAMSRYTDELSSKLSEVQTPLALVIAPTRELANQIFKDARSFAQGTPFRAVVAYGGVSVSYQLRNIEAGCNILIGTPGRLKDFFGKRKVSLANLKYLILDEADRMLDMGFIPDIREMVNDYGMPPKGERKTLMFSATFPEPIQELAREFLEDYVFLTIGKVGGTSSDIEQSIEDVPEANKRDKLVEILSEQGGNRNLVFVQTKRSADFLASFLSQNGFPTTSIHGDRLQQQREEALSDFRQGKCPVLIATAVAARGLDIADVKQVVNFDLPDEIDEYIHRIGRTGRIGNKGKAISFFARDKDDNLARGLVKILSESDQTVPDWLEEVAETALGSGYGPKGGKYGAKDTRRNQDGFSTGNYNAMSNDDGWDKNNNTPVTAGNTGDDEDWD